MLINQPPIQVAPMQLIYNCEQKLKDWKKALPKVIDPEGGTVSCTATMDSLSDGYFEY